MGSAHTTAVDDLRLSVLDRRLLNDFQQHFPLVPRPYALLAERLGTDEAAVIRALRRLQREGFVSRVGPVFRPHRVGVSTLAAMAVPGAELERVAALISAYPEVNHNYEREHRYNLWFVVTAPGPEHLARVLAEMERRSGQPLLALPMLDAFQLDLGFPLAWGEPGDAAKPQAWQYPHLSEEPYRPCDPHAPKLGAEDLRLVAGTQEGLPLEPTPFAVVAQRVGTTEAEVLRRLRAWSRDGTLRRIGVIVRHRKLGYRANAMVVWDVPDEQVAELGGRLGRSAGVTLCYRRRRVPPLWPYNLYCMLHGRGRTEVTALLDGLAERCGVAELPREILFSGRCFKQRGARYQPGVLAAEVGSCAMRRVAGA